MAADLQRFAQTSDLVAATTKKLQKQALLATYLRELQADDDVARAVRYSLGQAFPTGTEKTLGVSSAIVTDSALQYLGIDYPTYRTAAIAHGELGEAMASLWDARPPTDVSGEPLTLAMLSDAFEKLASTGNIASKTDIVLNLFHQVRSARELAYLTKIILGDMRTGVQEGVMQAAVAEAFTKELALIQRTQLLVGDLGDVAILAKHNRLESATFRLFHPIQFMLATPQETATDAAATLAGRTFLAEDKLDGIRAQVHKSGDRVAIYTRTMDRTDESFPDIVQAVRQYPGDFLLDGEIVPWRDGRVLPFQHIQRRLGRKVLTEQTIADHPAAFIAFDLLYLDGDLLMEKPLRQRRERLATLPVITTSSVEVSTAEEIEQTFQASRDRKNEGLILKDLDSIYSPGKRGKMWLKLKTHLPTLDCVVTAAEYGHGKRRGSLSDYTFGVWDREPAEPDAKLVNIGKAFSGVTDEEIAQLTELFLGIATSNDGRVFQVRPQVVMEIAFDQIQSSNRHAGGYALRFPRIKRIRWDKKPEDADRLLRVAEVHASTSNFAYGAPVLEKKGRAVKKVASEKKKPRVEEPTLFDGL